MYSVDLSDFDKPRPLGISGFMRLRNEADFLIQVVESCIDALDELIIVYNRCTDKTPLIAFDLQLKYGSTKVKVYPYEPHVYPQGSKEHAELPPDSPHSLVNYYNWALSKTTYSYAIKIDGDDFFEKEKFQTACDMVRNSNDRETYWFFAGINLWDKDNVLYINGSFYTCGGTDHGFFPVSSKSVFIRMEYWEYLKFEYLKPVNLGYMYYHLKYLKKDRGVGNYDLKDNPNSIYHYDILKHAIDPQLYNWEEFKKVGNFWDLTGMKDPLTLTIKLPKRTQKDIKYLNNLQTWLNKEVAPKHTLTPKWKNMEKGLTQLMRFVKPQ